MNLTVLLVLLLICSNCSTPDESKTNTNIGPRMNNTKRGFFYNKKCTDQKDENGNYWARGDGRSQGGGIIWFIGKGMSKDYDSSFENAEGQAISRLVKECGFANKVAIFNERCVNEDKDEYYSYARLSIKADECQKSIELQENEKSSFVNKEFNRLYLNYLKNVEKVDLECKITKPELCLSLAKQENINKNLPLAKKYAAISCLNSKEESKGDACFFAGVYSYDLGHIEDSSTYFLRSCESKENFTAGCLKHASLSLKNKKLKNAIYSSKRVCTEERNSSGCSLLGFALSELGQNKKAKECFLKMQHLVLSDSK